MALGRLNVGFCREWPAQFRDSHERISETPQSDAYRAPDQAPIHLQARYADYTSQGRRMTVMKRPATDQQPPAVEQHGNHD